MPEKHEFESTELALFLLGELLKIVSEKGKGQLIFTSHNLRPLETVDKSCIAFTTTDPDERYVRMTRISANNNPRMVYYRNIILGTDSVQFYDNTNSAEIDLAFRKGGETFDTQESDSGDR